MLPLPKHLPRCHQSEVIPPSSGLIKHDCASVTAVLTNGSRHGCLPACTRTAPPPSTCSKPQTRCYSRRLALHHPSKPPIFVPLPSTRHRDLSKMQTFIATVMPQTSHRSHASEVEGENSSVWTTMPCEAAYLFSFSFLLCLK